MNHHSRIPDLYYHVPQNSYFKNMSIQVIAVSLVAFTVIFAITSAPAIELDYDNISLETVARDLSQKLSMNILVTPDARNIPVTFRAKGEAPLELFRLLLKVHGIGFIREGENTYILFRMEAAPKILEKDILTLTVRYGEPETIASMIKTLFPELEVIPFKESSKITVSGILTDKIKKDIENILKETDICHETIRLNTRIIELADDDKNKLEFRTMPGSFEFERLISQKKTVYSNTIVISEGAAGSFSSATEYPAIRSTGSGDTGDVRLYSRKVGQTFNARLLRAGENTCLIEISLDLSRLVPSENIFPVESNRFTTTVELNYGLPVLLDIFRKDEKTTSSGWNTGGKGKRGKSARGDSNSRNLVIYLEATKL